jgi:cell division septum initiation protein DivIVA
MVSYTDLVSQAATSGIGDEMTAFELQSIVQQSIVSQLIDQLIGSYQSELHTIRAENHEEQQRLDREQNDREQIEQEEAEENERAYRETMQRLGMVHDPAPFETDEYRQFIGASCRRMVAAEPALSLSKGGAQ